MWWFSLLLQVLMLMHRFMAWLVLYSAWSVLLFSPVSALHLLPETAEKSDGLVVMLGLGC